MTKEYFYEKWVMTNEVMGRIYLGYELNLFVILSLTIYGDYRNLMSS